MLRNKFVIVGSILFIFALFCFYNKATVSFPKGAFVEVKKAFYLENGVSNVSLDLKKDAYLLRIHYSYKQDQKQEFFFNGKSISPLNTKIRGENEVNYIYLPAKIINNGQNLLTVKFPGNPLDSFSMRIRNYQYKIFDSVYILTPDSAYLSEGKGINVSALYKIVITKSLFWCLLIYGFLISYFLYLFKKVTTKDYQKLPSPYRNRRIKCICNIIVWGFVIAVVFHLIKSFIFGFNYPNNTFLFIPSDRFLDFLGPYDTCKELNPYLAISSSHSNYYPFANILMYFFTLLPKAESLILFIVIFVFSFLYINLSNLNIKDIGWERSLRNILIFTFLSYPFLFCLDRANNECIVFVFLSFFIYFFINKKYVISSLFLSFAIAMKAFPAVFLILLLSEKKYRETIFTVIFVVLFSTFSLIFFKGGFLANLNFVLSGFNYNNALHLCNSNNVVQRGLSLFTLMKIYCIQTNQILSIDMVKFLGLYAKIALSFFIFLSGYVLFIEKELWKKVMILVAAALLLPHVSADYKLIYIFIPMFLFINSDKKSKFDLFYIIIFGLLLIPKDYYIFPKIISDCGYSDISIAVVLNILLIIVMIALIIIDGFSNWSAERKAVS